MSINKDTYFLNSKEAFRIATQNNKVKLSNNSKGLQLCFYHGDRLENEPKNCINVPMEELSTYFASTKYRTPKNLDITNSGIHSDEEVASTLEAFKKLINVSNDLKKLYIVEEQAIIKQIKPSFILDNLKVFMVSCREDEAAKNIYTQVEKAFDKNGFKVNHHTQKSSLETCGMLSSLKACSSFEPNVIFTINYLDNEYLPEEIITVNLFTNTNSFFTNGGRFTSGEKIQIRNNDYIFTTSKELHSQLADKQIASELVSIKSHKDYLLFVKRIQSLIKN